LWRSESDTRPGRATGDSVVLAWNQQVVLDTIRGEDWLPYRPPGDPAPPFAEYASVHSTFSGTAAEVLTGFTGRGKRWYGRLVTVGAEHQQPPSGGRGRKTSQCLQRRCLRQVEVVQDQQHRTVGPAGLAPPDRHPGAIGRAQRPVRLAGRVAGCAGRWHCRVGWPCRPPDEPTAGLGLGTQPDHGHKYATLDGAAAPTRQPHRLAGNGLVAYLADATASRLCADPGGLLERIPSPLTLASDLGKRRCAQRLALDT
jgi:hypothetical protein